LFLDPGRDAADLIYSHRTPHNREPPHVESPTYYLSPHLPDRRHHQWPRASPSQNPHQRIRHRQ
jgi:hypothetical protein